MRYTTEIKEEACSTASKIVRVKVTLTEDDEHNSGLVTAFECNSETSNCRSRCLYRMLLEDY